MPRDGTKNLIPINQRTKEEQKKIAKKGGIASGKARAQKKTMMEEMQNALKVLLKDEKGNNITTQYAICLSQIKKALEGDTKSAEFVRDTSGQKPVENINANIYQDVIIDFDDLEDED